jgi:3-hydroxyisobutyrate dehydrogenase-like beta-hydroxyacid dehydrogenase
LFLEAPFTGSKNAAEQRQTVYYLGGTPEVVEKASPILEPLSSAILHIGPLGSASSLKLAMNLNIAGVAQSLCESLTLCRAEGIPDDVYFNALSRNISHSGVSDLKGPKLRQRDYSPQFSLKHMAKDLRLAMETAADLSLSLEQTGYLKKIYDRGMAAGWSDDDFIGLMRLVDKKP